MTKIEFEITTPKVSVNDMFSQFWIIFNRRKVKTESKIKTLLEQYARTGHRELPGRHYKKQSGKLAKATKAIVDLDKEIRLYVDVSKANYAKYVIEPRQGSTWKGDDFITETIKAKTKEVEELLKQLFNDSIAEWNRS